MPTLDMTILYHAENDWSIWISGRLYSHVSSATLNELMEYAVVAVELAVSEPGTPAFAAERSAHPLPS